MRISGHDLKNIKAALAHCPIILESAISQASRKTTTPTQDNIWGEGVKIVTERKLNPKPLSLAQKEDVAEKYRSGMSMGAIARHYGCNHSTVGRILRRMDVEIRS